MRCASAAPPTALRKGAAHKGAIWWRGTKPSSFTNLRGGCPFSVLDDLSGDAREAHAEAGLAA